SLFTIFSYSNAQVPGCITSVSPINGITAVTTSGAVLRWGAASGSATVAGYRLFFGTDVSATNIYNGVNLGNVLTTTLGTLLCNQTYYWQIIPFSATGTASGCSINNFSTALTPSAAGSIASYTFSGNANDVSGNSRNGLLINSPTLIQDRNGNSNSAYFFNGINQEIRPSYSSFTAPSSFTFSLWFNTNATIGGKLLGFGNASSGNSGQLDRHLYISNSGVLYFGVLAPGVQTVNSGTSLANGKWHHVIASVGTVNGLSLYVDGVLVSRNAAVTSSTNTTTGFWRIANDLISGTGWPANPSSNFFRGSLDEIFIYNREFTQLDAAAAYGAFYNSQGCTGDNLILSGSSLLGASYSWSGPNGFTSFARIATVPGGVTSINSGLYTLTVTQGSCSYLFNTSVFANPLISNNSVTLGSTVNCFLLPTVLPGSIPLSGDGSFYTYIWQSSTTSSTTGFVGAAGKIGSVTGQNYTTSSFTVPTWFRRVVYSGGCSDVSQPVLVSPSILNNTITSSSVSICVNETPSVFIGTAASGGGGGLVYQWLSSSVSSTSGYSAVPSSASQNLTPSSSLSSTSWFRRVVTSSGFCVDTSAAVRVNVISSSAIPGNTATYGVNGWNVYGYNVQNNGNYPNDNSTYSGYTGFYTTTVTNFDTRPLWGNYNPVIPMSNVSTYQGCLMPVTNMSFAAKGTGLVTASGLYRIDLPYYDDNVTLRINGVLYFQDPTWFQGVPKTGVYIGPLDNNDLVDLTINQGGGGVGLAVTITALTSAPGPLVAGSITGSDIICPGNTPTVLSNLATATGGCTPVYTWQISTDSTNWINLSNSNSA
ncbi:MAG: hypothetical protein K2Q22_16855, partial [Cytophagales bacterium]|nr:hypothetical protein [Cytophagales bacterium]